MAEDEKEKEKPEPRAEGSLPPAGPQSIYALGEKIVPVAIEDEMKSSYIDYAMSVIVGRALPDVRDGLKPVHRRILYAMQELGLTHTKPHKKSARIVGEVLGKYHPHGDTAVYETLVRMAQEFSMRYPLVDGQGNFGSVDGDNAAAMRYTEARLDAIADELLGDIDKNTVDFVPNFDESLTEPSVLPAKLPNLLVNGSSGIAVGMATNIPPQNLGEVLDGVVMLIDDPEITVKDLRKHIKGPDFPTGGLICGGDGIKAAYETGRGRLKMRARAAIETGGKKDAIVITEIPYMVNKSTLIATIANLVEAKKVEGIYDVRDESDREGMRIVVELKKDQNPNIILNLLYKHTQLQETFGVIMLALVDGQPKVLNLKQMLEAYLNHRAVVIVRRTQFELDRAEKRAHILEGLKIAIANLDKVIKIIRAAKNPDEAKAGLLKNFKLTEVQAKAILEMQLQRLTALEREKIDEEYLELIKKIEYYKSVLKSRKKVLDIVKDEAKELKKKFGDERRTEIVADETDVEIEDLIAEEDVLISISYSGYVKRIPVSQYRRQNRGGRGVTGAGMQEEDFIKTLFLASTHDTILFFTNKGRVFARRAFEIPQASRVAKGKAIVNLLALSQDEKVSSCLQVTEFDDKHYILQVTKNGLVKKTRLDAYAKPRSTGLAAIHLREDDVLIDTKVTSGKNEVFLATRMGKAIRFKENEVREMGRTATGVRGINLAKKDEVISVEIVDPSATVLTVTTKGFGKRSPYKDYRLQSRGGKGIINIKCTAKNGQVADVLSIVEDDEVIVMTSGGIVFRTSVKNIRLCGRSTQGVHVIRLEEKDAVATAARVVAKDEGQEEESA
jgi:DNA gyrase subunit A